MKALPISPQFFSLRPDSWVYLDTVDGLCHVKLKSIKALNKYVAISFPEITNRETAFRFRGSTIHMDKESVLLKEGEYLYEEIIGLSVFTAAGDMVGTVEVIFETGSNEVYVVRRDGKEYLIPAIRDVIEKIDLDRKRIVIKVMKGLLD